MDYAKGQTSGWSNPINFSQQPDTASWAPTLVCDHYQNLHVFWEEKLDAINGVPQSDVFYKNDLGGIWSKPIDLLIAPRFEELHAAITPNDKVHLVWTNTFHELTYFSAYLAYASQIKSWSNPIVLENSAYASNITVDKDGKLYIIYVSTDNEALSQAIYFIYSTDAGETWSTPKTIININAPEPSNILTQLEVDGKGRYHVVYTLRSFDYGKYSVLGYLRSTDAGEHWYFPLTFPPGTTFQGVASLGVYAFGDDEIHLTYDMPDRMHQWSTNGGESWSQAIPLVNGIELGAAFGGFNELVKDSTGVLHVVFAESRGVFHSTWEGNKWSKAELIDAPKFDPHGQTMAICQGNRLSVLYGGNEATSEIWYSEKMLDIPGIFQSPIPAPVVTATVIPTPSPTNNQIVTPTPTPTPTQTKITFAQPSLEQKQSTLVPLTLAAVSVIALIGAAMVIMIIQRNK